MLYDNRRIDERLPEHHADVMYVIRDFEADIGGTRVTTPHLNLHRTNNGASQYGLELGLPFVEGAAWCGAPCRGQRNFVPAGSTVRATVEYLVPPSTRARYYGTSDHLNALPEAAWRTPQMALALAAGNALSVEAAVGRVIRAHPVEIEAAPGGLAAQFTLTGGLGFVPITVRGLSRHDGWRLEAREAAQWTPIDQAVHGNDFWQTRHEDGAYTLTWNVPNRGEQTYRVIWRPR
jgi:hypothetical protein